MVDKLVRATITRFTSGQLGLVNYWFESRADGVLAQSDLWHVLGLPDADGTHEIEIRLVGPEKEKS